MTINRKELIDFLLRRRFGTLALPPAPILGSRRMDAALAEASYKRSLAVAGMSDPRPTVESARNEYEAMSADALQGLADEARDEDQRKAQEAAARIHAEREARWPRWARKDLWSEAEFAALCSGLVPGERGMSGDPGKVSGDDRESMTIAINCATDDIRRGTLSKTLAFVPRDDADTASVMYGTARHYVPAIAAEWAATRFDTFPENLLVAVRQYAQALPATTTLAGGWPWGDHETDLLQKLAAAADKFWKRYDPADPSTAPTNAAVEAWLKERGVAGRNAQVMATILRADGLPTGPRK